MHRKGGRGREALIGAGLVFGSLLVCFVVLEAAARIAAQRASLWRYPNYITAYRTALGSGVPSQHDARLGWVPRANYRGTDHQEAVMYTADADSLRQHNYDRPRPPAGSTILAVGDSYTEGGEVEDNASWPAHLERLAGRRVINGGMGGYGIDQIVLRAEALVAKLRPDVLLVGFIADDIGRAELTRRSGAAKPYFVVEDGALALRNVPVPPPEPARLDLARRVLGHSFLVDLLMRRLDMLDYWYAGITLEHRAHRDGERVACLLMQRLAVLPTRTVLVAQYTPGAWRNEADRREQRRLVAHVAACAQAAKLEVLDTFDAVQRAVAKDGVAPWYINWHMNDAGNALTARLIARHLARVR
ncbi:MAG: SGNH/GDSL hydrolase family protein [Alphaproteobacteria bacterium]|nr:SGNH/GDSL hydrolase family protein [Alphaproteobacteria bacterium]MCW5744352.1 SGNH/GDSL hydrolase family protein [Alphaproteobacteria bacterium]